MAQSTDGKAMAGQRNRYDFILNTVAAPHDLDPFLGMLKRDGTIVLVGAPSSPHPSPGIFNLIMKRRSLAWSRRTASAICWSWSAIAHRVPSASAIYSGRRTSPGDIVGGLRRQLRRCPRWRASEPGC